LTQNSSLEDINQSDLNLKKENNERTNNIDTIVMGITSSKIRKEKMMLDIRIN